MMSEKMLEKCKDMINIMGDDFKELFKKAVKKRNEYYDMENEFCAFFISSLKKSEILKDKHFDMGDNGFYVGIYDRFGVILDAMDKDTTSNLCTLMSLWHKVSNHNEINLGYQYFREDIDQYENNCYVNIGNIMLSDGGIIYCQTKNDAIKCAQMFGFIIKEDPNMQNK